ncbi:MAG: Gfo/Idh/MocA family oxidoreductase [Clostridiales bacterium]|jgi:predicted dehydrogenase|nr:Gfo/Idh/MocA family oxidoreductase [Clostridiales bacterium]
MNFGVIGFGSIAKRFAESLKYTSSGKLHAVASKSLTIGDGSPYKGVKLYRSYDDILEDADVEAIYIALPHGMHKEWAIKALKKRLPVLCEKPAVLTTNDFDEIKALSKEYNTYFLEALKTKFNDGMFQLKKDLPMAGKLKSINACFCSKPQNLKETSYLYDPCQGGALYDIGSYLIGFVLALIGMPVAVTSNINWASGIDTHFTASLLYDNGVEAIIEGAIDRKKERLAIIEGSQGIITIPMFNRMDGYNIELKNGQKLKRSFPIYGDDMTMEIEYFIKGVEKNETDSEAHSLNDSYNIIKVMELIRGQKNNGEC